MNTNNEANNNGSQAISLDLANIKAYEWFSKINTNAVTDSEKEYVDKLLTTIALNGIQDSVTFADSRLVFIATKILINHSMSESLISEYGVAEYSIYLSYVKSFYDADNSARNEIIEFVTLWLSYLVNEYVMNEEELRQLSSLANVILEYVNTMEVVYKKVPDFVIATLLDVSKWEVGEPVMPIDNTDIQNADLGERETEVNEGSDETQREIKELQDASETFQFLITSGATEEEVKELQEAIETFDFLLLSLHLQKLGLTEMEQDTMQALILNLTEEPSYTSVNEEDLSAATGIDTKKMRGVLASLVKKGIIYIDKAGSELELINLNKDFWYLHPQWKNEVDNYPQLQGKYAKGGTTANKRSEFIMTGKGGEPKKMFQLTGYRIGWKKALYGEDWNKNPEEATSEKADMAVFKSKEDLVDRLNEIMKTNLEMSEFKYFDYRNIVSALLVCKKLDTSEASFKELTSEEFEKWKAGNLVGYFVIYNFFVTPFFPAKFAKGGKLSNKATYIPKRDIAEIEVEANGKTRFVDGANLYDGVYVKKGKFAKGGQINEELYDFYVKNGSIRLITKISEDENYLNELQDYENDFDEDGIALHDYSISWSHSKKDMDNGNSSTPQRYMSKIVAIFEAKRLQQENQWKFVRVSDENGNIFYENDLIEYGKKSYEELAKEIVDVYEKIYGIDREKAHKFVFNANRWDDTKTLLQGHTPTEVADFYLDDIIGKYYQSPPGEREYAKGGSTDTFEITVKKETPNPKYPNAKGVEVRVSKDGVPLTQVLDSLTNFKDQEFLQQSFEQRNVMLFVKKGAQYYPLGFIDKNMYDKYLAYKSGRMGKGGTARRYFEDVKKTVSKGYNKSKEYTQKKIHDINKKIALDVLDKTKNKVDNLKKLDLKEAEKIVQKSYAKGGTAGKYNSLMELYNLRDAGYRTVSLNGFEESIGYVIDLRLDDKDLKKIGERSYITTYERGGDVKKKTWVAIFRKGSEQKILEVEAATEQDARIEAEKGRNIYGLSKDLFLYDLFMKYEKGGEVRKLKQSDAILYKKEVWYVTEKNGVMGITNFSPGAWGFNYPFIPLNKVDLSEATDFYGNKVEYAKGGVANSIKYNFKLYTPDGFEDSLKDEKRKIDLLRKFIDFDEVIGSVDYEKMKDNTVLNFLLNKKKVMALVGHFNENSGQLEAVIEADGNTAELNYHPFDGMSGVDFYTLEENIKKAFKSMNMYNAVVSVEGYEEYAESIEGLENAKSRIKDIKGNTKFQVVKGENVGVGKRVDSSNVIAEYADGGVVKKVKTLNDIQNDPRVSDIYKDNSTGEPGYWMSLKEGYVSAWDRGNSVRSENLAYLKDMLNTPGGIITKQEFDTTFAEDEYANGGKMQDYYDGQGDEGEGETFEELRGQIIRGLVEDLRVSRDTAEKIVNENEAKLTYLIESEGETNIYTLVTKIQGDEDEYSNGGEMGKGDVTFIQYKDNEIMYEPNYNKYYANDVEFDSLEQAKNFLDSGQMSGDVRGAYERGLFEGGGRSKKSAYTILDDAREVVVENADEEAVILFANTMFYYDTMDSGEEQIETFAEAVSGLKSMDYSVQKIKMAESGRQQLKNK